MGEIVFHVQRATGVEGKGAAGVAKGLGTDGFEDAGTSGTVAHQALNPARGKRAASAAAGQDQGAGWALLVCGSNEGQEGFGQPD